MSVTFAGRTLDQVTKHDPLSLNYLVGDRLTPVPRRSRYWVPGKILDQGREGACTGFAASADAAASPVRVPGVDDRYAQAWYKRAQQLDEWPGENYEVSLAVPADLHCSTYTEGYTCHRNEELAIELLVSSDMNIASWVTCARGPPRPNARAPWWGRAGGGPLLAPGA